MVVLEGLRNLVHYWAIPGKAWNRDAVIIENATGAGAFIQRKP